MSSAAASVCSNCDTPFKPDGRFCAKCGARRTGAAADSQTGPDMESMRLFRDLERRLDRMEMRTNLISPKFWTRAAAVIGHGAAFWLAVYAVILVLVIMSGVALAR